MLVNRHYVLITVLLFHLYIFSNFGLDRVCFVLCRDFRMPGLVLITMVSFVHSMVSNYTVLIYQCSVLTLKRVLQHIFKIIRV